MSDLEEKQDYLRSNIVDLNYDPSDFLNFLVCKHGEESTDLDHFSMSELKKLVSEFQETHNKVSNTSEAVDNEEQDNHQNNKIEENDKSSIEQIIHNSKINEEVTVNTTKVETSPLLDKSFIVTLSKPEKKEGGIFSKSYITYLLTTSTINTEVRRRYSDFEWLRSIFLQLFPDIWIPPIPIKSYSDRFDMEFITKRMRYLQKFIDSIINNKVLAKSNIFYDFLILNENDLNNKKKVYAKLKTPQKVCEMLSLDESFTIKFNETQIKDFEKLKFCQSFSETLIDKLSNSIRSLNAELTQVSNRMHEIANIFEQLTIVSVRTNDNKITTDTYKTLKKIVTDWGNSYSQQRDLIDMEIREYMNYIKREFICLKEVSILDIYVLLIEYCKSRKL